MDTWALEYWYWLIFGMILILSELLIPSFTAFWFGLGAIAVAAIYLISPTRSLSLQIFMWAIASILFTYLWFKFFRPHMINRIRSGISKEMILGESGFVIKAPVDGKPGVVRFSIPFLGLEEWPFTCEEELKVGDRVTIKDVFGNTLIAKKRY
jgi:membrane protein implicated in regulation of membrane protease activity